VRASTTAGTWANFERLRLPEDTRVWVTAARWAAHDATTVRLEVEGALWSDALCLAPAPLALVAGERYSPEVEGPYRAGPDWPAFSAGYVVSRELAERVLWTYEVAPGSTQGSAEDLRARISALRRQITQLREAERQQARQAALHGLTAASAPRRPLTAGGLPSRPRGDSHATARGIQAPASGRSAHSAHPSPARRWARHATLLGAVVGLLIAADGVATIAWQEPLTAIYTLHQQSLLSQRLTALTQAYATPAAAARSLQASPASSAAPVTDPSRTVDPAPGGPAPASSAADAGTIGGAGAPAPTPPPRAAAAPMPAVADTTLRPGADVPSALARAARATTLSTRSGDPLGRITIPDLGANFVFVQGTGTGSLREGPGHYAGTTLPGLPGTVGLAGHRTTFLAPFRHLDSLRPGMHVRLTLPYGSFDYAVTGTRIVSPTSVWVVKSGRAQTLVMTACNPLYSDFQRIVVFARLVREEPAPGIGSPTWSPPSEPASQSS